MVVEGIRARQPTTTTTERCRRRRRPTRRQEGRGGHGRRVHRHTFRRRRVKPSSPLFPNHFTTTSHSWVCRMGRPPFAWWGTSRRCYHTIHIIGIVSLRGPTPYGRRWRGPAAGALQTAIFLPRPPPPHRPHRPHGFLDPNAPHHVPCHHSRASRFLCHGISSKQITDHTTTNTRRPRPYLFRILSVLSRLPTDVIVPVRVVRVMMWRVTGRHIVWRRFVDVFVGVDDTPRASPRLPPFPLPCYRPAPLLPLLSRWSMRCRWHGCRHHAKRNEVVDDDASDPADERNTKKSPSTPASKGGFRPPPPPPPPAVVVVVAPSVPSIVVVVVVVVVVFVFVVVQVLPPQQGRPYRTPFSLIRHVLRPMPPGCPHVSSLPCPVHPFCFLPFPPP